jgi:hypothetical protein
LKAFAPLSRRLVLFCLFALASKLASFQTKKPSRFHRKGFVPRTGLAALIQLLLRGAYSKPLRRYRAAWSFLFVRISKQAGKLPNKKALPISSERLCAQNWIRTSTSLRTLRPEHSASTNFAIWAFFYMVYTVWLFYSSLSDVH